MEILFVLGIIFLFVFLNSLTYLAGAINTPLNYVFLGTVHWPGDYFYYLSQFAQGRDSWFLGYDLFTSDFFQKTLVGWVNIFLGRIFYLLGINHLLAYQLSVVIFSLSFLGASYLLIREIFEKRVLQEKWEKIKWKRITAFLLFVTSNAFPKIVFEEGRWTFSYFDFWFNNGIAFNRLGGVPHHLIARTCISLGLFLALRWWRKVLNKEIRLWLTVKDLVLFVFLGLVLASLEPVHWTIIVGVLFLVPLIGYFLVPIFRKWFCKLKSQDSQVKITIFNIVYRLFPGFFFFLGGFPMVFYLKKLFTLPPYSQLAFWENSQQLKIDFLTFLLGNGPVAVLSILGIILVSKKIFFPAIFQNNHFKMSCGRVMCLKDSYLLAFVFSFMTIFLYFSSIPSILKIVNVRFLPATTTIFLAIFATEFIFWLAEKLEKNLRQKITGVKFCLIFLILSVVMITIPATFRQIQIRTTFDPKNSFFYLPQEVIASYKEAERISTIEDIFLVIWPYNWSFPGITGRRVYEGHNLLTIDYEKKDKETAQFFFGRMEKKEREEFLRQKGINYVLFYTHQEEIKNLSNLQKIFEKGTIGIYKVRK